MGLAVNSAPMIINPASEAASSSAATRGGCRQTGVDVEAQGTPSSTSSALWDAAVWKYAISGGVAGAFSKTCTAPLARLTILYQLNGYHSTAFSTAAGPGPGSLAAAAAAPPPPLPLHRAFQEVVRREGIASLWKGNGATIVHRLPYSAINFVTYEHASAWLARRLPRDMDVARRLAAGGLAGLLACSAAYPLDLVRTRLAAQTNSTYYRGVVGTLRRIAMDEGITGLYRGLGATLLQVVPSLSLNFTLYESCRAYAVGSERGAKPSTTASLACGCVAGFATSTATFPLDVVRRRMQVAGAGGHVPESYTSVIRGILRTRGLKGFYAGIVPEYCKVLPGVAIAFCTYEQMKSWLGAD